MALGAARLEISVSRLPVTSTLMALNLIGDLFLHRILPAVDVLIGPPVSYVWQRRCHFQQRRNRRCLGYGDRQPLRWRLTSRLPFELRLVLMLSQ